MRKIMARLNGTDKTIQNGKKMGTWNQYKYWLQPKFFNLAANGNINITHKSLNKVKD